MGSSVSAHIPYPRRVFGQKVFRPYEMVTHVFSRVAKAAELQAVHLHDLRHTYASLMLQADVHPKILSERLGHARIAITMDIYFHVLLALQKEVANRFSSLQAPPDEGR